MGCRRHGSRLRRRGTLLTAALASLRASRWGAARVFNQHFRDLTGDVNLLCRLNDAERSGAYVALKQLLVVALY